MKLTSNARIASLSSAVDEKQDAQNDLDSLRLEAEQSDPAVKSAWDDIKNLQSQIGDVDNDLEKFESKDHTQNDEKTYGIEIIKRRIKMPKRN